MKCWNRTASNLGLLFVLLALCGSGRSTELRGRVVDAKTGAPLPGANVELLGTLLGAGTDLQGRFRVLGVAPGRYRLRVSMIGYAARVLPGVWVGRDSPDTLLVELVPVPIELNPVVVTADRRNQRLRASPNSIAVLPAAEIESRNSLRLDEALEMVPGVYFMKDDINIRGSTGYRANSANRVLLLVDGIPVMTSDIGGISWDMLPLLDIERVEVVKGAGSALYGSYALGGVVNVITKQPQPQGRFQFRLTGGIFDEPSEKVWVWAPDRTLGYARTELAYSKQFGRLGVRLSASRFASTGDRKDGDFEKWNASGSFRYRWPGGAVLNAYAAWLHENSGVFVQWRAPFIADSTDASPSQLFHPLLPDEEGNRLRLSWLNTYLKLSVPLSARSLLRWRVSLLRSMLGNQFQVAGDFFPANGLGGEVQWDWLPHARHYLSTGLEFKLNLVKGVFFGGEHTEYALAWFLQDEWRVTSSLKFTAGFRFDRHELVGGPVNYQFNPRAGLNFQLSESLTLRASSGRGFRVPTVAERTIHFDTGNFVVLPNPNLQPERSWSHEVGARLSLGRLGYLDAAVFQNDFDRFIEAKPDLSQTGAQIAVSFQNVARAQIRGFEAGLALNLWRRRFSLSASVTHLSTEDLELRLPLSYRPRWLAQVNPTLRLGPLELRADYRFASRLPRVEIYTLDQRVAQHELNLRLRYRFKTVALVVGSNNALNYNYTQVERNLGEIRSFFVALQGHLGL